MDSSPVKRLGIGALAIAALGASFAAGAAWDDTGKPRGRIVAAPDKLPVVPQGPGSLVRVGGCESLLDWYVDNTVDQVTPWGWNDMRVYYTDEWNGTFDRRMSVPGLAPGVVPGAAPSAEEQSSSATGTNVQESGVDEPDVVKTNGRLLVRIEGDDLTTYDVSGAKVRKLSTIDLPGRTDDSAELLLIGDQVVVLSQEAQRYDQQTIRTTVRRVDLGNPEEPEVLDEQSYDAALISARQYGGTVRLVLGTGLPALDFVQPNEKRTEREALKENRRIVRESDIEDWLPSVREDDGDAELAVGCDSMSRPEDFAGGGSVVVVGYDAGSPTERSSLGVATSSSIVYSSSDRIYLATSPMWSSCCVVMESDMGWGGSRMAPAGVPDDGVTSLHAFELAGTDATYVGSGEVEGMVKDRWSMDAVDGTLRVAVGATSQTGNFNSIVTLREKDGALEEIGRLDRLGVNEQLKSVRWFDDLAFVVTFRQTDPLYAIDLSNPARPRKLAALKIPGFSEYLHPIGDDLMIGIGTAASRDGMTRGGQAAVFDISDLANLRRVAKHGYGMNRQTLAGSDPRQFTWLPDRRTALTVVSEWGRDGGASGLVSVLEVGADGALTTRMLRGTYGYDDVAHLRTVPLPDGRVVLATENGARFLTW